MQNIPKVEKIDTFETDLARGGKMAVMMIFVSQFVAEQIEMAAGVSGQEGGNISGTSIQGMGPSPTAKAATKATKKTGAREGKRAKDVAKANKQAADPATLKRATGRRPARSSSQIAKTVMAKLIKVRATGVKGAFPTIMAE